MIMKKLSNILLMAGVAFLATLTITSCQQEVPDTNPLNKQGVNLVAYGPNPVARGGYLRMMGTGLDQVQSVTIADQAIDSLKLVSNEELKVLVPQDAQIGNLVLFTKGGDTITGRVKITYTEPVGFAEENPFEPATVKAGQTLTINGEYLNLVEKVIFDGAEITKFAEQDRKYIKIENFPATAKTGAVTLSFVATGDTIAQEIPSEVKLEVVIPTVDLIEAKEVHANQVIHVVGKDLDLVTAVLSTTGDSLYYEVAEDAKSIDIKMPEVVMNGTVNLVTASGVQVPAILVGVALPKVTSIEGNTGVKAESVITINGTDLAIVSGINFVDIKGNAVAAAADGLSVTDTKVTVALPAAAVTGAFTILTTANINLDSTLFAIETLKPAVTEFAPAEIAMGGTTAVNGTDLDLVKSVTLTGGAVLTPADASETTFNITIPYAEAETGKVTLTMANGETVETDVELTINAPECCYATAWPDPEVEIKAGTMMVITVANIDKLTGVKIDGQDCQIIKMGDQLYIAVPEAAGKNSVITLVSENGSIDYPYAFVPNTEQKRSLWKGALPISWSDDGKVHVAASAMAEVPAGAELVMCYTQADQVWGQAQMCFGDWSKKLLPDGTTTEGDGALVPTDIYGWFEDGILYRETPIVLTADVLAEMRAHVDDNGYILHIQGSDLIFNEIYVRWTISLEVDCAPFLKYENQEGTFAYPYYPSWGDNSGKLRLFRDNGLKDLNLKAGKSKIIFYKDPATTGQIQFCNPNWSELTTVADWDGGLSTLEYVFDEDAIKCVTGETADGWGETAFVMQGDGLTVTKIAILP